MANFGFEDIIFQSGICSSGSLNGVLVRSHYKETWTIHSSKSFLGQLKLAFSNIVTGKYLTVSNYCKLYSRTQRMRKFEISILKFLVFVFYVAFRLQLLAIVAALECLLVNFFFTKERVQLSIKTIESLPSYVDEWRCSYVSHEIEIIEDKYKSFKKKIVYGKKRKNCTVLANLVGYDGTATSSSCWHSRE